MQLIFMIKEWYNSYPAAILLFGLLAMGITAAAIAGYFLKSTGSYVAMLSIGGGMFAVAVFSGGMAIRAGLVCLALLAVYGGINYLVLSMLLGIKNKIAERKRRRTEKLRKLQYTLPDRDNTYVRDRLHTALQTPQENAKESSSERPLNLRHANNLLAKVKAAPLTVAERLHIEEMSRFFALCMQKSSWDNEDVQSVNEALANLLKLSAKYNV